MTEDLIVEPPVRPVRGGARRWTLDLDVGRDVPPDRAAIAAMCEDGLAGTRLLGDPLALPADADAARHFLIWIACLRDLTATAVPVDWRGAPSLGAIAPALRHIAPPHAQGIAAFEDWQRFHRYGICFWRSGPGFATITDRRNERNAHQYILDTADYLEIFTRAEHIADRSGLAAVSAEALAEMEADALILSLHGWSLALPFRMRHWPVPFTAI